MELEITQAGSSDQTPAKGGGGSKCSAFPRPRNPPAALTLPLLGMLFPSAHFSHRKLIIVNIRIS